MPQSATRRFLYVEGKDDEHVIGQLLIRRGADPQSLPQFKDMGGKQGVLRAMKVSIGAGTGKSLGFVLDANDDPANTWTAAASRLREAGVRVPNEIPVGGFVGESTKFGTRVGVWLMPDNRQAGALEDFLAALVSEGDRLLPHARNSMRKARLLGARFSDAYTGKALLHTWLAWQEEPGRPYGVAIKARYLRDDSDAARRLVAWFGSVFGLNVASSPD